MKPTMISKPRMKHAFSNPDAVAELFAKQSQTRAHCKKQMFFEGTRIYSYGYHYLLGAFVNFKGLKIAVVNNTYWSRTTSGHSWSVRRALENAGYLVLSCRTEGIRGLTSASSDQDVIDAALNTLDADAAEIEHRLFKMSFNPYHSWFIGSTLRDVKESNELCLKLGLKRLVIKVDDDLLKQARLIWKQYSKATSGHSKRYQLTLGMAEFTPNPFCRNSSRENRARQKRVA